ncbi:MAG TPA: PQQ-dependent sugar dehydrogenase [Kofleriaceae bacterium]|nr:PQQ-dependent sugar dehydrogenase [Kofleriaceae bacterium]
MRRLAAIALVGLFGCGDNRKLPADAAAIGDGPAAPASCPVRGDDVVLQPIVMACTAMGAPPPPACIDGVITLVTSPPGDTRSFVVELHGRIRVLENDQLVAAPFLDITKENGGPVDGVGVSELGLLGLAFHPMYAINHQFYVFYTMDNPDPMDTDHPYLDVLARFTTSASDPDLADPTSGVELIAIPDPFPNHNAGMIEFGPDGYLYISTGDGGASSTSGSDPFRNAQNPSALLGKILRIDVDHQDPGKLYASPPDNPFYAGGGAPEVYILGLRNPWRWSFDQATGDMWIADVGLATWEELDVLPAGHQAGANLGWSKYEGNDCFEPPCDPTGMTFPVEIRNHSTGWWAIIGGEVYRGSCYPDLVGTYFYTDCGASTLMQGRLRIDDSFDGAPVEGSVRVNPASLHAGAGGELYETDIYGNIWRIEVAPRKP